MERCPGVDSLERSLRPRAHDSAAGIEAGTGAPPPLPLACNRAGSGNLQKQLVKQLSTMGGVAGSFLSSPHRHSRACSWCCSSPSSTRRADALPRRPAAPRTPRAPPACGGTLSARDRPAALVVAQFFAMLIVGALSTIAYLLIGVEAALALGLIAGLCEFVPFVAAIPPVGMRLPSRRKAMYVASPRWPSSRRKNPDCAAADENNLELPPFSPHGAGCDGIGLRRDRPWSRCPCSPR